MVEKDLRQAVALLAQGDWQAAHLIVQADEESRLACWAHGIVHDEARCAIPPQGMMPGSSR